MLQQYYQPEYFQGYFFFLNEVIKISLPILLFSCSLTTFFFYPLKNNYKGILLCFISNLFIFSDY